MKSLESVIQDFGTNKEAGITHRRPFSNLKDARINIYNIRCRNYA